MVGTVAICLLEAALIVFLLWSLIGRRRAEEALRDVSRRLIVAQEDERARLARELHDDVTQRLARLAIDVGAMERHEPAASEPAVRLREIHRGLVVLSEDIHALSYRLHSSLVEDLGLPEALDAECQKFGGTVGISVRLGVSAMPRNVPREAAFCLFRVAQECLRNVDRHAKARTIDVSLNGIKHGLELAVRDDGIGFDTADAAKRRTLGHTSLRERVHLAGGRVRIDSAPGRGTTVTAWVPLDRKAS